LTCDVGLTCTARYLCLSALSTPLAIGRRRVASPPASQFGSYATDNPSVGQIAESSERKRDAPPPPSVLERAALGETCFGRYRRVDCPRCCCQFRRPPCLRQRRLLLGIFTVDTAHAAVIVIANRHDRTPPRQPAAAPGKKKHRIACACCFAFGEFVREEYKSAVTDELYMPYIHPLGSARRSRA
jgi:hypothetical protein